jgi:hypothetical protein
VIPGGLTLRPGETEGSGMAGLGVARRLGSGLSRELWLVEVGIFLNMLERGIGADGPIRQHYLVTAFDTDDESRHVTEVGWPVFQLGPAGDG